jgi:hypothetical protein
MRNISDTTASWLVVLGLLGGLAVSAFIPTHGDAARDVQEPAVQRLGHSSSELADAAANARVPNTNAVPPEELWWAPSEDWNFAPPQAEAGDALASAEHVAMKKVAGEPPRTWFCNFFRLRGPTT